MAWGVLTFGAVRPWGYWPLAAFCGGLGFWAVTSTRAWEDMRVRRLGTVLIAIAATIAIQIVALPYSLLVWLSPGVDRYLRSLHLVFDEPAMHALSIASWRTTEALGLFVACALLLLGLVAVLQRTRPEWLTYQILVLGIALACIGVVQKATMDPNVQAMYGFWRFESRGNPFGPFVNRNHFAGWMVMAVPLVGGYMFAMLTQSGAPWRRGWGAVFRWSVSAEASRFILVVFATFAMGMSLVLTGSRSGIAAFAIAMAVFGALVLRSEHGRHLRRVVMAYLLVLVVGAVSWAGTDATVTRFLSSRSDASGRLAAWQDTIRMIRDSPVFGMGLGTYRPAMIVYQTSDRDLMFVQAHNDYLQLLAEGGLFVGVPAAPAPADRIANLSRMQP